jgi:hypothetical protein
MDEVDHVGQVQLNDNSFRVGAPYTRQSGFQNEVIEPEPTARRGPRFVSVSIQHLSGAPLGNALSAGDSVRCYKGQK